MKTRIGGLYVRRSIWIKASATRVWREFTSLARVRAWLGQGQQIHRFDLEVDGEVRLSVQVDNEERHFGGRVLVVEVGQELTFESQWQAPSAWPVPTFWTIRLSPLYDGTQVEILHHGFERLGAAAADNLQGYEEGWTVRHLSALRAIVEDTVTR